MDRSGTLAAAFLAGAFAVVSYVMLFVEPDMGFQTPADFFDPAKITAGYASTVWSLENLLYFAIPVAVVVLASSFEDEAARWSGVVGASLFLLVASMDRVGIQLPDLEPDQRAVLAAASATLPVRFAFLRSSILALGLFAWRTTRLTPASGFMGRVWSGLGWLVLVVAIVFLFAFIPVPLAFFIWGMGLTVALARSPALQGQASAETG